MARPKQTPTPPVPDTTDHHALAAAGKASTELVLAEKQADAHVRGVATQIGYLLPADCTDADIIQRDVSANMRRSVEACLEVGKGLVVLKAACSHGEFIQRLDAIGLEVRVAQRFMASAFKFSNAATSPLLIAAGNQSKLFELLVLDDDQIEELALTGQTGELALDEVASMSVKELRAAVRNARDGNEAKDRVIADQARKINEQAEALAKPFKPKKTSPARTEEEATALAELTDATNAAEVQMARLGVVVNELQDSPNAALRERAVQSIQYMVVRLREIVAESGLEVTVDDEAIGARPEWLGAFAQTQG